jgi:hypothetical protein
MTKFVASNIYISRYTCNSLSIHSGYDDIVLLTEKLASIISEYAFSKNISVMCAKDFLEFKSSNDDPSLEEILFEIAQQDLSVFSLYYSMFEQAISHAKSNISSCVLSNLLIKQKNNAFPQNYALSIDEGLWPDIIDIMHTSNWKDTLKKNSTFIACNNKDKDDFISLSIKNYDNLVFHEKISNTLDTILNGTYWDYRFIISDALNALNQSYNFISNSPNSNQDDLNIISDFTGNIGKKLSCSRQGANKPMFNFPSDDAKAGEHEEVNCEYHLKINWNDRGIRLLSKDYVRIYFALKFNALHGHKKIKVAYIGKHY